MQVVEKKWTEIDELNEIVEKLKEIERFEVEFEQKKTVTHIAVQIKYDALKLPQRAFSFEARQYLDKAYNISDKIESKSIVLAKKIKNTRKNFRELVSELEDVLNKSKELISEFDEYLAEQQQKIKELLKKYREENSKAYREFREEARREREAITRGEFEKVSDERIKEFLKKELGLKNIVVIDKNSRYRAVLVAKVSNTYTYPHWLVHRLYLAGLDDNQEAWDLEVTDFAYSSYVTLDEVAGRWTVEKAMSIVFCVTKDIIERETTRRQGDVLVVDATDMQLEEFLEKFGRLDLAADERASLSPDERVRVRYREEKTVETDEYEILPNHKLCGCFELQELLFEAMAVEHLGFDDDGKALIAKRVVGRQLVFVVKTKEKTELIHPSHQTIELEAGRRYVLVPYPSFFSAD